MTGKFYLQAKVHGSKRFVSIAVFRAKSHRPEYRLQRSKAWTSFFNQALEAECVKAKLEQAYPSVAFKVNKDKGFGSSGFDYQ